MKRISLRKVHCSAITLLNCLLLLVFSTSVFAKNSFLIAPGRIDFDLSKPNTQSFILTNNGDGTIRLKIEPTYFAIDDKALSAGIPLTPDAKVNDDLRPYMRISPRVLSLKPGQRRDIRLSVRPKPGMPDGDYRAHLLVKMMEVAQTFTTQQESKDNDALGMKVDIKLQTAAAVYGHHGNRQAELSMKCSKSEKGELIIDVTNPSIWRFEGALKVFFATADVSSEPLYTKFFNSIRESQLTLKTDWKVPSESVKLHWIDNFDGAVSGQASCQFN